MNPRVTNSSPAVHVITSLGVIAGGIIWLILYAANAGEIEFDGPAGTGLGLGLIAGGITGGIVGIIYDLKQKESLLKTLGSFVIAVIISCFIVGTVLASYAQNKWDYAEANKSECSVPEDTRPLACE